MTESHDPAITMLNEAEPKQALAATLSTATVTNQSSVGKTWCSIENRSFWAQRRRFSTGEMGTYYSAREFTSIPINWNPGWNCEASKYYTFDSEKGPCYDRDSAC